MSTTINDVAKAANVSKATISRYLNDKSKVNTITAERISRIIEELNYVPNMTARNLVLKQSDRLGILSSGICDPFWSHVLDAAHNYLSQAARGLEILTLNCSDVVLDNSGKSMQDKIQALIGQCVAGILVATQDLQPADIAFLRASDVPFVLIQGMRGDRHVNSVATDNYTGTLDAALHLTRQGHQSVVYIGGAVDSISTGEQLAGFRDAMVSQKLFKRANVLQANGSFSDGYWRMKQILTRKPLPTAVMFSSDAMAYAGMMAAAEAGVRVPDDISIIGFGGLQEEAEIYKLFPPLSTIYQPMRQIGEKAAEILLQAVEDEQNNRSEVYQAIFPTKFLDKGSCRLLV